jgi:peptidoglycan/LPS O-acetylase OafA/YrhL
MPLQEYWIHKNRHRLKVRAFFPFGATLDYISFAVPRCPMWLGNLGLEWLFRLWLEPGRLFERYVIGNPSFAMRVLKDWFADPEYSLSRQEAALPQLRSIPSIRMERNLKAGRINNFEGLRGLLAFWVVIGHVLTIAGIQASSMGIFSPLAHGFVAVDVFVIMSGFFIFYLLDRKQETYRPFITRRFLRLFPVYVVCLLMSILLMNISLTDLKSLPWYHPDNQSRIDILESSQQYFLYHFIAHLTMLHGVIPSQWLPYSAFAFIGQAWSISLEWQFYLVAPALMWICKKRKWLLGILTIITTGLLYWQFKGGAYLGFLPNKFPLFLLGILSFWSWKQPKLTPIMLACAGLVFLLTDTLINKLPILIWLSIFFPTSWGWGVLNHTVLLYLGRISYSVYVSHMMILYVMLSALTRLSGLSQPIFLSLVLASVIPLTILISHVLYHRIEKPFIDYGKLECIS